MPCSFDIRYKSRTKNPYTGQGVDFGMRPHFKKKFNKDVTNSLFGNSNARTDDQRSAGRIGVSHLYHLPDSKSYFLKVWGHVPNNTGIETNTIANEVKSFIYQMFPEATITIHSSFKNREGK